MELIKADDGLKREACILIKEFWKEHNHLDQTDLETNNDYMLWSGEGHILFLIKSESEYIGFAHLGNRGAAIDWLEDIFVIPKYRGKGIGSQVIEELEKIVMNYSESLYIEVAARNLKAMKLYSKLGYNCLNTITIRKDFKKEDFEVIQNEKIGGYDFEIKKYK